VQSDEIKKCIEKLTVLRQRGREVINKCGYEIIQYLEKLTQNNINNIILNNAGEDIEKLRHIIDGLCAYRLSIYKTLLITVINETIIRVTPQTLIKYGVGTFQYINGDNISEYPVNAIPDSKEKNNTYIQLFGIMFQKVVLFFNGSIENIIQMIAGTVDNINTGNICEMISQEIWNIVMEYNGYSNMVNIWENILYNLYSSANAVIYIENKSDYTLGINNILDGTVQTIHESDILRTYTMMLIIIDKLTHDEQIMMRFIMRMIPDDIFNIVGINLLQIYKS
jgi:hypothetical protein